MIISRLPFWCAMLSPFRAIGDASSWVTSSINLLVVVLQSRLWERRELGTVKERASVVELGEAILCAWGSTSTGGAAPEIWQVIVRIGKRRLCSYRHCKNQIEIDWLLMEKWKE